MRNGFLAATLAVLVCGALTAGDPPPSEAPAPPAPGPVLPGPAVPLPVPPRPPSVAWDGAVGGWGCKPLPAGLPCPCLPPEKRLDRFWADAGYLLWWVSN